MTLLHVVEFMLIRIGILNTPFTATDITIIMVALVELADLAEELVELVELEV